MGRQPGVGVKRVERTYRPESAHDGGPGCPGQNVAAGPFPRN